MLSRWLVACVLVLAGCVPTGGLAEQHADEVSCETVVYSSNPTFDLLLVVDTTPEMAAYRDRWVAAVADRACRRPS